MYIGSSAGTSQHSFASCLPLHAFLRPAWWIMSLRLCAWNFKTLLFIRMIFFASVCVNLSLCHFYNEKNVPYILLMHIHVHTHTSEKMWWHYDDIGDLRNLIASCFFTLWSLSFCCADSWSCWPTALTLHPCKYSKHIIPVWAFGQRSTLTYRFNLYTSFAIWNPVQPTSPNAGLCPHFMTTITCLPEFAAGLLLPSLRPSSQPVRHDMSFDSHLRPESTALVRPLRSLCTMKL